jgi:hypothetical protein
MAICWLSSEGSEGANHQPELKMGLIFKHDFHDEFGSWPLAYTPYGCMDFGEILSVARAVGEGDDDAFYEAWVAAGDRFAAAANDALAKG